MYLLLIMLFSVLLLFLNYLRKKRIIRNICNMSTTEKCELLNELIRPLGYSYIPSQDIFAAHIHAYPQETEHLTAYKQTAPRPGMVCDILPVCFIYEDKTWLIRFEKGQSGINTIAGISIHYADHVLDKQEQKLTHKEIARIFAEHWQLSVCKSGCFSGPADISMRISLTFPSFEMAKAFAEGLVATGYPCDDVCIYLQTVSFTFCESVIVRNPFRRLRNRIVQYHNHFLCRVCCLLTRPFCLSSDRMLYLHYYLPFTLNRMFRTRTKYIC